MRQCRRKVVSEKKVAGAIKFLVYSRCSQFECDTVLYEALLVLMYGSGTMVWKKRERFRIRVV